MKPNVAPAGNLGSPSGELSLVFPPSLSLPSDDAVPGIDELVFEIQGPLDPSLFSQACRDVVADQPTLRTSMMPGGSSARRVSATGVLHLRSEDWREAGAPVQADRLRQHAGVARAELSDPAALPLFRLGLFHVARDRWCLAWASYAPVIDGWTRAAFLREVFARYRAITVRPGEQDGGVSAGFAARLTVRSKGRTGSSVAFLFPGGGTQYVGMGRGLLETASVFGEEMRRCGELLQPSMDLTLALYPPSGDDDRAAAMMERASVGLPALFAVEYAMARQWLAWGLTPSALIGHSMGEYTAACLSGVMSLPDALSVVLARGRLFDTLPPGGMLAVPLSAADAQRHISDRLSIAAINTADSCVVAGSPEDLAEFDGRMAARDIECRRLRIAVAAHSHMVEGILGEFERCLSRIALHPPVIPVISNVTGTWLSAAEATSPAYWVRHLRGTVQFHSSLGTLLSASSVFLEVGPGQTLLGFLRQHANYRPRAVTAASIRHPKDPTPDVEFISRTVDLLAADPIDLDDDAGRRRSSPQLAPTVASLQLVPPVAFPPAPTSSENRPTMISPLSSERNVVVDERSSSRTDGILAEMLDILTQLSGLDLDASTSEQTFLALGFDSLFLGQAGMALQKRFGVRIRFRDFLEVAPTPAAMAHLLDTRMPADVVVGSPAAPSVPRPAEAAPRSQAVPAESETVAFWTAGTGVPAGPLQGGATSAGALSPAAIERLLSQQLQTVLEVTRQQLAALGTSATLPPNSPSSAPHRPAAAATSVAAPVPAERERRGPIKVFAPAVFSDANASLWLPIEEAADGEMTVAQRAALDDLIASYCARTAQSKAFTDATRPYLADPRGVVGFAPAWKETVYQIVTERSAGVRLWDVDGNEWLDVTMGFGAAAFGHSPPFVMDALKAQLERGFELGSQPRLAGEVARLFCELTGAERVCFCSSGTEAVMGAVRLARAHTGRARIATFMGDTHGRLDEVNGRPVLRGNELTAVPAAAGISPHGVKPTLFLDYGDPRSLDTIRQYADELAAVLVEPVRTRSPDLQPIEFLHELRAITRERGIALIVDEVVTGFRVHPGGAQKLLGIESDLSTWGKAAAAGMPIGVISGKAEYMDALDGGAWRFGDQSQPEALMTNFGGAGTFAKHPLTLAAALATLQYIKAHGTEVIDATAKRAERLATELNGRFRDEKLPLHIERFSTFWCPRVLGDRRFEALFFVYLRSEGVHIYLDYPCFISTAHTDADITDLVARFMRAAHRMAGAGLLSASTTTTDPGGDTGRVSTPRRVDPPSSIGPASSTGVAGENARAVPLSPGQREIWLAARLGPDAAAAFNLSTALDLDGPLDAPALRGALDQVVARHEALRTTFAPDGSVQWVKPSLSVPFDVIDLSMESDAEQSARIGALVTEHTAAPFDLESALVRATLVKTADERHTLLFTVFHLVCDGWSLGMVIRDLAAFYTAGVERRQVQLPAATSFADFDQWRREPDQVEEETRALSYWRARFADSVPTLDLPVDRPRPRFKTYVGAERSIAVPPETVAALRAMVRRSGCTVFAAALSAFTVLLHRLSNQDDVVVGLFTAGQAVCGKDDLVGHCVNLLPYRSQTSMHQPLMDHLRETRSQLLDTYDHQSCTYGSLVEAMALPRDPARLPLLSATMTHETDTPGIVFAGLAHHIRSNPAVSCNFDLELYLMESEDGVRATFRYNRDLFDQATVDRWLQSYVLLLGALAADSVAPIGAVALLDDKAVDALSAVSTGRVTSPRPWLDVFDTQVARAPEQVAAVFGDERWTYRALDRRANQVARLLQTQGAGPDVLVGVAVERSADMLVSLLGVLKAGAAYVPLDPAFPPDRLAYIVEDSGMSLLVTHRGIETAWPRQPERIVRLDADAWAIDAHLDDPVVSAASEDSLAYVIYTSGSTGRPKGVEIPRGALTSFLHSMQRTPGCVSADRLLAVTTLSFDIAALELFLPLMCGATVIVASRDAVVDPRQLAALIGSSDASIMQATPAAWRALIDTGWAGAPRLKVLCGGEALSSSLAEQLLPKCAELWNMYGPTETTIWSTCRRITDAAHIDLGHPIDNTEVLVLSDQGQLALPGVPGMLHIGGAGLARGYHDRPDLTAARFVSHPWRAGSRLFNTGDRVRWKTNGGLEFMGRGDHQVKIRGFRVELGEIETALRSHPDVRESVVVLREDTPGDARLVAYIEGAALEPTALRDHLKRTLPDYFIPSAFVGIDTWPLTPNGKIDRAALRPPAESAGMLRAADETPLTPGEQQLAKVWQELLGIGHVGRDEDFFLIGGHSLLAVRLIDRLHKEFGVALGPADILRYPQLKQLAARIAELKPAPPAPVETPALPETTELDVVQIQKGGSGTPFYWIHGIGGEVFSFIGLSRALASARSVYGFAADWTRIPHVQPLTVEQMAAGYVRKLREHQPRGPYHLGGFCAGSLVAYEMARQLEESGDQVGALVLLDWSVTDAPSPHGLGAIGAFVRNLLPWFREDALLSGWSDIGGRIASRLRRAVRRSGPRDQPTEIRDQLGLWRFPDHQVPMLELHQQALGSYVPQPVPVRAVLFFPRTAPLFGPWTVNRSQGWEELARGGVETHFVAGSHSTILHQRFAAKLAALLNRIIDRAERRLSDHGTPSARPAPREADATATG